MWAPTTKIPVPAPCPPLDCDMRERISAVNEYLASRPGTVGYVIRDRVGGGTFRNNNAGTRIWAASTMKLAMVVDLFTRADAGSINLSAADRDRIQRMLHSSDNDAADALWQRYSGADQTVYNTDFAQYGMTDLRPQTDVPYWGLQKCTADDLDRLIVHALAALPEADTAYLVEQMQNVDPVQQWGVWGAGAAEEPGNKDGWSEEDTGWVINSVGFAGPGQRYTLAIMNSLGGAGGYDEGVETVTHVAALLLAGR
ncbi:tat pathway signal sequence [Nocardia sp. NBC_01388]